MSYLGHTLVCMCVCVCVGAYTSAEIQSVYSTAPADWTVLWFRETVIE